MTEPESRSPDIEPDLQHDPELADILKELSAREPIFHRPEFGVSRSDFERLTAEDFWEVGASGRRYSRDYVLNLLEKRHAHPHAESLETKDFHCRRLEGEVYLLTYTLRQGTGRLTRRSTIWRRSADGWKILFHQGTVVQDEDTRGRF